MDAQPRVRGRSLVLLLTALLPAALLPAGASPAEAARGAGGTARPGAGAVAPSGAVQAAGDTAPDGGLDRRGAGPEELRRRLRRLLDDPVLSRAHVGLVVTVAETGRVLYERAPHRRFVPASNAKLFTAAAALHELGPDHRWTTRLVATGPIRDGTLDGDLWLVGGGDPRLTRDDLAALSRRLREAGIRRVEGDLVGDGRRFPPPQWGSGWTWSDTYAGWGAGVSALRLYPGRVRAGLVPGARPGDTARLVLRRGGPLPAIRNRVRTGAPGSDVRLDWVPAPRDRPVALEGWIPAGADTVELSLAPSHPTTHLAAAFADRLETDGVPVGGEIRRARPGEAPERETWSTALRSEPLSAVLPTLLGSSDNQVAEMLLRTMGAEEGDRGTAEAGLEVMEDRLRAWGVESGAADLRDGSGLSRYSQVTPTAVVRLLRRVWQLPDASVFRGSLPVASERGTLAGRLAGTPAAGNLRGKTGSLSSVRALSGYVEAGDGRTLVFSLLLNGYDGSGDAVEAMEDLLVEQLSLYRRPVEPGWPRHRTAGGGGGDR